MRKVLIYLIQYYQKIISPYLFHSCLFSPSCSEYTKQAILKDGCLLGMLKGLKRIFQCQSFFIRASSP